MRRSSTAACAAARSQGRGHFLMHGAATAQAQDAYEGDVALSLGGSRIDAKGKVGDTLDVDARFAPLQLDDLLPDGAGTLRGTLKLTRRAQRAEHRRRPHRQRPALRRLSRRQRSARTAACRGAAASGALAIRASGLDVGTPSKR